MGVRDTLMQRAAFLDRDGVINRARVRDGKPYPAASIRELEILPGVAESLDRLRKAGFLSIVVTNQPDVARGTTAKVEVEGIHAQLRKDLAIDAIYVCWHDDEDCCDCRKPQPGLLYTAAHEHNVDLKASFMVGDRWRDIEAGQRAGCRTIWVNRGYSERTPAGADFETKGLAAAVDWILRGMGKGNNEKHR